MRPRRPEAGRRGPPVLTVALARSLLLLLAGSAGADALAAEEDPLAGAELDGGRLSANLLPNPSMERGQRGRPLGWSFSGEGNGRWEKGTALAGSRSLRIDGVGAWRSEPFPLEPGRVTLLGVRTRLRGSGRWGALARVDFLDADGRRLGKLDPFLRDEHDWTDLRWAGVAPPGTVAAVLVCYTHQDAGLSAWFDDAQVRQWVDLRPRPPRDLPPPRGGRLFDFGTATSPAPAPHRAVSPRTRYRPGRGFGWTQSQRLDGRDQTEGSYRPDPESRRKAARRTLLDPLTRDYVTGVGAARFRVDLPAGRYQVLLLAGHSRPDEVPPYFSMVATVGSEVVARIRKLHPGVGFAWESFPAEVGEEGVLQIGIAADRFGGAWALSGLLISPEKEAGAWERSVLESIELLPADLLASMHRIPASWVASGEARSRPIPPPRETHLIQGTWPEWGERLSELAGRASPGLSIDVPFALRTDSTLNDFSIQIVDEPEEEGARWLDLALFYVAERALRYNRGYVDHGMYRLQPDALRRDVPSRLDGPGEQPFWLRAKVAPEAPPGSHTARLRWSHRGGAGEIPVRIEVLPFAADRAPMFQNVYYQGTAGKLRAPPTIGVKEMAESLRARDIRDIVDHLGSTVAGLGKLPVVRGGDGRLRIETAFARERLEDFHRAGVPSPDVLIQMRSLLGSLAQHLAPEQWPLGKHLSEEFAPPPVYWETLGDLLEKLDRDLQRAGVGRRFYNPWDEPHGEDVRLLARVSRILHERVQEPLIFCNNSPVVYFGGTGVKHPLTPHCNVWWVYGTITDEIRKAELDRGTLLMGRFAAEGATAARLASGLGRWRRSEVGGNWWAYDAFRGSFNTHLDGASYGDRCLIYPVESVSPRLAWEATRVGHEDHRYLRTLERWCNEGELDARRAVRRAARRGRRLLEELWREIDPTAMEPAGGFAALEDARGRVLDRLMAIWRAREAP